MEITSEITKEIINLPLASEVLWLFFAGVLLFFLIMTFIFHHHWKYYGIKGNSKVFARALFWVIAVFLILMMILSILFFENI